MFEDIGPEELSQPLAGETPILSLKRSALSPEEEELDIIADLSPAEGVDDYEN